MPGVEDPAIPEELRKDLILHVTGFPVSLERQFPAQKAMLLNEFLDQDLILFKGARYTPRKIIEWYANKASGAHYSSRIPEDFAALMTQNLMNIQPLANLLLQIGEATLAAGRKLLRSVVEFEIYALVVIPEQGPNAVQEANYLFDSRYEFTLSPAPGGLRHRVLTRPGTEPSMRVTRPIPGARPPGQPSAVQNRSRRFGLSVGSHLCARASSRQPLARLPLPSASSFICPLGHTGTPTGDFHPISSRPCRAYTTALRGTRKKPRVPQAKRYTNNNFRAVGKSAIMRESP